MYTKKRIRLLALLLSIFFLFAGCGGEDKPFEQLFDKTVITARELEIEGLEESGEKLSQSVIITDYQSYQSAWNELKNVYSAELPVIEEEAFANSAYLLIVHRVPAIQIYEYQVKEVSASDGMLFVQSELAKDPEQPADQAIGRIVIFVRLDKELIQDIKKVSVKTERVDKKF